MDNNLADYVRDAREAAGLTQEELEELADMSSGYIGQLERGKVGRPKNATLRKLSRALNRPLEELNVAMGSMDPPTPEDAATLRRVAAIRDDEVRWREWQRLPRQVRADALRLAQDALRRAGEQPEEPQT